MSDFMDFAKTETEALAPTSWDKWIVDVELRTGINLDGDETEDGYSLDTLAQWFDQGLSSQDAALRIVRIVCIVPTEV